MVASDRVAAPTLVEIPFVCPVCAAANAVNLIALSRAGGVDCGACARWLRAADVMRAIHSPRAAREPGSPPPRAHTPAPRRRAEVVWPPTAESRAAALPLRKPRMPEAER
jgi:hypothetical protein